MVALQRIIILNRANQYSGIDSNFDLLLLLLKQKMKFRNFLLTLLLSLIASLPFSILYFCSDILFFFAYNVVRYRKKVIFQNIKNSFPEKSNKEIRVLVKKFYHNFCDILVEISKSNKMTVQQLKERVTFVNSEIFDDFYSENKNVFATLGHCGNWEWVGNRIGLFLKHEGAAVYKPINDKFFNNYLIQQRQKYKNTLMIHYKKVFRTLVSLKDKLLTIFVLADQSPAVTEIDYFVEFLGRKTAFYQGVEKVARTLGYAVAYLEIQRVRRGYYKVEVITITDNAAKMKEDEITRSYVQLLEKSIKKQPDNWLWSHKRWKLE
jgi:Kdo2-lipid IVA lauroyltransferase/acyltransferase